MNDRHPKKLQIIEAFRIANHTFKDVEDEADEESEMKALFATHPMLPAEVKERS